MFNLPKNQNIQIPTQGNTMNNSNDNNNNNNNNSNNNEADKYGLLGLLNVIRMTNKNLNTLSLGTDLTTLGLNLNSTDCLYNTFISPFADSPKKDPEYFLPRCYYIQAPLQPPNMKMDLFSEETLFYIFYSTPLDSLQLIAAEELYNRNWRFHTGVQRWFIRASNQKNEKQTNKNSNESLGNSNNNNNTNTSDIP